MNSVSERVLAFAWTHKFFDFQNAFTLDGKPLKIISTGTFKPVSGPDFDDVEIMIGDVFWKGSAELHIDSSAWLNHGHQADIAYNRVVLHIVYNADTPVKDYLGNDLPTFVLKPDFEQIDGFLSRYDFSTDCFSPKNCVRAREALLNTSFIENICFERFNLKADDFFKKLIFNKSDWLDTFWQHLTSCFGFSINSNAFSALGQSVKFSILQKNLSDINIVYAILLGQASLLDFSERLLTENYNFYRVKYNLNPIDTTLWKRSGLRPQNFPHNRICQLSALIVKEPDLFSKILDADNLDKLYDIFNLEKFNLKPDLGKSSINLLIINAICVLLWSYGKYRNRRELIFRAVNFLKRLPAEKNSYIDKFLCCGIKPKNAFESQALIYLYKSQCIKGDCRECMLR